jgi:aspartokinase/homoserine dehydrogenase 1
MTVMKFGGTSVQDAEAIERVINIVKNSEPKCVIVVSAFSTVTNSLVSIIDSLNSHRLNDALKIIDSLFDKHQKTARELNLNDSVRDFIESKNQELSQLVKALDVLGEVSPKSKDWILSFGEVMSSFIIYHAMKDRGLNIIHEDATRLIKTDSNYNEANVDYRETDKAVKKACNAAFKKYDYIIMGGFIASDMNGKTTTLGRGGSDYSAAIIAAALSADNLEIWTDVSGIMTSDPRLIKDAKIILSLSYSEASELRRAVLVAPGPTHSGEYPAGRQ